MAHRPPPIPRRGQPSPCGPAHARPGRVPRALAPIESRIPEACPGA